MIDILNEHFKMIIQKYKPKKPKISIDMDEIQNCFHPLGFEFRILNFLSAI